MFEKQLADAGIPLFLDIVPPYEGGVRRLGAYLKHLHGMLDRYGDCKKLIIADAWDMLFYGTAEEVYAKVPRDMVLMGAERNCWPDASLAPYYPGNTPWRFLNSGLMASSPDYFADWFAMIEKCEAYHPGFIDQQWFSHRYLDKSLPMELDTETDLGYCMFLEAGEMQPVDGRPHNILTGTFPNFVHFNGKHDSTLFLWKLATSCASSLQSLATQDS